MSPVERTHPREGMHVHFSFTVFLLAGYLLALSQTKKYHVDAVDMDGWAAALAHAISIVKA